jgi:limonene-1,2-epoxide hydrolase
MKNSNEQMVRDFCAAWARKNPDELLAFFADDAIYHNIPMPPMQGKAAIREVFNLFLPPSETIEFEVLNLASSGNIVFTERVDRFLMGGNKVELPVAGVFEIENGLIKAWRDYFDMNMFTSQTRG